MERINLRRLPDHWTADDEALAQSVDDATAIPIYISYRFAGEWFDGIHAVLDELAERIPDRPRVVMRLLEHFATDWSEQPAGWTTRTAASWKLEYREGERAHRQALATGALARYGGLALSLTGLKFGLEPRSWSYGI